MSLFHILNTYHYFSGKVFHGVKFFNSNKAILVVNRSRFPPPLKDSEIIREEMKCACRIEQIVNWPVMLVLLSRGQNEEFYKVEEGKNTIKLAWILSLDRKKKKSVTDKEKRLWTWYIMKVIFLNRWSRWHLQKQLNFVNSVEFSLVLFFSKNLTLEKQWVWKLITKSSLL